MEKNNTNKEKSPNVSQRILRPIFKTRPKSSNKQISFSPVNKFPEKNILNNRLHFQGVLKKEEFIKKLPILTKKSSENSSDNIKLIPKIKRILNSARPRISQLNMANYNKKGLPDVSELDNSLLNKTNRSKSPILRPVSGLNKSHRKYFVDNKGGEKTPRPEEISLKSTLKNPQDLNWYLKEPVVNSDLNNNKVGDSKQVEFLIDKFSGKLNQTYSIACKKKVPFRNNEDLSSNNNFSFKDNEEEEDQEISFNKLNFKNFDEDNYEKNSLNNSHFSGDEKLIIKVKTIDEFISLVREKRLSPNEFIYLKKRKNNLNDAYNLKIVSYHSLLKKNVKKYYTLSGRGLTLIEDKKPVEFKFLHEFLTERRHFNQIKSLSFFTKFRKWKTLKKWVKILFIKKSKKICKKLEDNLFIAHPIYQKILLKHKSLCCDLEQLRFIDISNQIEIQTLDIFASIQETRRRYVSDQLKIFSNKMHENVKLGN